MKLLTFKNCKIEIIGNWIWVSGNTKYYKEILKSLKFNWINNKKAWAIPIHLVLKFSLHSLKILYLIVNLKI